MTTIIQQIEQLFVILGVVFFKTIFFFLQDSHQSFLVSFFHYAVFIVGFYFFIYANPKGLYRKVFFLFVVFSMICYYLFDRCILTQVETIISKEKNSIQQTMEFFFGGEMEGNLSSKMVLTAMAIILGMILLHDR